MATLLRTWSTNWFRTDTSSYGNPFDGVGQIKVYLESQNTSANTSYIRIDHFFKIYTLDPEGGISIQITSSYRTNNGSYGGSYQSKYKSDSIYWYDNYTFSMGSTYHTVTHNADGTCQLYVNGSVSGEIRELWDYNYINRTKTSAFNVALPTIPRGANITLFSGTVNSPSTIFSTWSTDATCNQIAWKTSGDWNYITVSGTSGSFTVTGLNPNTNYNLYLAVKRADTQVWSYSGALNRTTWALSTSTMSNFNLGTNSNIIVSRASPTITHDINVYFKNASDPSWTLIKTLENVETSTTLTLTSGELATIYALIPNRNDVRVELDTITKIGTTNYGTTYAQYIAYVVNSNPIFTTFTYADTNETTKAITKLDTTMIKGYSNAKLTITTANKATAQNGATMVSYSLGSTGLTPIPKAYSADSTVEDTLNGIINASVFVSAIDSRGNQTTVSYTPLLIDYSKAIITNATVVRTDNVDDETTLTLAGTYTDWSSTYTDVANSIQTARYRYRESGGAWSDYITITLDTNTGGVFNFTDTIDGDLGASGFTTTKTFEIEVDIIDKLATTTSSIITLNSAQPLLWKYKTALKSILGIGKKPTSTLPHGSIDVLGEVWSEGVQLENTTVVDNLTSTSTTNALSANMGRELNTKHIMTADLRDTLSITSTSATKISVASLNSVGTKLSIASDGIKIGAGVSKILVSAQASHATLASAGLKQLRVYVNSTQKATTRTYIANANSSLHISNYLLDVSEDDIIYLYYIGVNGDTVGVGVNYDTWMTVEVVA